MCKLSLKILKKLLKFSECDERFSLEPLCDPTRMNYVYLINSMFYV